MSEARVIVDPEVMGGAPVFAAGTRVPVRILFEHLEAGDSLDVFLEDFQRSVERLLWPYWRNVADSENRKPQTLKRKFRTSPSLTT
jgi:hypothetical protein